MNTTKQSTAGVAISAGRSRLPTLRRDKVHRKLKVKAYKVALFFAVIPIIFFLLCAIAPALIAPYDPTAMMFDVVMKPPSLDHLFGTDQYGRDVFTLVVYGSQTSILTGVIAVLIGGVIGGGLGAISGYVGGVLDMIFMRVIDVLMTVPNILLALLIAVVLEPTFFNVILAVSVASIPTYARVMRGEMIRVKNLPFIMAARSIGTPQVIIFLRHCLPNVASSFLVIATMGLGTSILAAASLSFLGLGVLQEIPDWGTLLSQGRGYLTMAWWICTFPGLAITIYVLSINIIGDQMRDSLAPKLVQNR